MEAENHDMIILENKYIKATFATKGAELQSLHLKETGVNYLWSGDPLYWGKHSPVLFPIVGALKDGSYQYKGKTYELSRHGFARDMEFNAEQVSPSELHFTIQHTKETLKLYPFTFKLSLKYHLSGPSISCVYEVHNTGSEEMLFSIGGHPAFAVPLNPTQQYTDYYLEFNKDTVLNYHKVIDDLVATETEQLLLDNRRLQLRHNLFYQDALVLKTLNSDSISIKSDQSAALHFKFEGFPYFGIWAAKDAPFVCLEPWCGVADGQNHNQQLEDKEGIETLAAGQHWQRCWKVEIE